MMRRKIYDTLLKWKEESRGATAIMLEGARRVGKSYIVEEFAKNEYDSYILIDFSNPDPKIISLFKNDIHDIRLFLDKLGYLAGTKLYERNSLIIFDEVQCYPPARQAIKHLVKDGRYDYIETGSLLSIKENVRGIVIPSEERKLKMYPMDFEEFCWAMGDEITVPRIRKHFEDRTPMGLDIHKATLQRFRTYMLVGGMPQAVGAYAEDRDFGAAETAKRDIIDLYMDDIRKKGTKAKRFFKSIPSELNKHDKAFTLSQIEKGGSMDDFEDLLEWFDDSMMVNICYNSTDPSIGIKMNLDSTSFKCYMGDTGLLITMALDTGIALEGDVYFSLLNDKLHINEGMYAENIVAQMLRAEGHDLFFYSFYDRSRSNNRYEVDYLIREGGKISPLEVKSSGTTMHASLDRLMAKHSKTLGQAYIICNNDLRKDGNILFIPIYMTFCLHGPRQRVNNRKNRLLEVGS